MSYSVSSNYFGGGGTGGGVGSLKIAKKIDNSLAVFADLATLTTYYNTNPKPEKGYAAVVGTITGDVVDVSVGYLWDNEWIPVVATFIGEQGDRGYGIEDIKLRDGALDISLSNGKTITTPKIALP